MGALRIERDDDLLRVTLARPETRNAFDADLIAELSEAFVDVGKARAVLLAGDGPSFCAGADVEWMRASVELDFDANVADANALRGDARGDRPLPRSRRRPDPGSRARRRRRPRRLRRHRGCRGQGGLRLLGGEARDHPRRDLALRAREDRPELGAALLRHRRALRRRHGAADRARPRGRRRPRRRGRADRSPSSQAQARGRRATRSGSSSSGPDGPETARRIAERRTSDEGQEGLRAFLERRSPTGASAARR